MKKDMWVFWIVVVAVLVFISLIWRASHAGSQGTIPDVIDFGPDPDFVPTDHEPLKIRPSTVTVDGSLYSLVDLGILNTYSEELRFAIEAEGCKGNHSFEVESLIIDLAPGEMKGIPSVIKIHEAFPFESVCVLVAIGSDGGDEKLRYHLQFVVRRLLGAP